MILEQTACDAEPDEAEVAAADVAVEENYERELF